MHSGHLIDKMQSVADEKLKQLHKPTNADKIRAMSDEELAEFILQIASCDKENVLCVPTEYKHSGKCNGHCREGRINWLKQEAKEDT